MQQVAENLQSAPTAKTPAKAQPAITLSPKERFINRELSWLAFNLRVMEEANNTRYPLLERLRFLSISANNLDEFFMVRVAGLYGQVKAGIEEISQDGLTPAQQLVVINEAASELMIKQQACWKALSIELGEIGRASCRERVCQYV